MGKIFCLIGKSGSGKDTILNELIKCKDLDLKSIILYTTRPIRSNETHGKEYYFVKQIIIDQFSKENKIIEEREYETVNGTWTYCTVDDGTIDIKNNNYISIVTLESYTSFRNYFGKENLIPFYIFVEDVIRKQRMLEREKQQVVPNYKELERRFAADENDYTKFKLNECGIKEFYNNFYLSECVNLIKHEILRCTYKG